MPTAKRSLIKILIGGNIFFMKIIFIIFMVPSLVFATYSIIGWDGEEMGVAVQSHWFSVGSVVGWAEAGVGVVATQSFANPSYGYAGIELLKKGFSAKDTLNALLSIDEQREVRQVAVLDSKGNVSAFTGKNCIKYASHIEGKNFSVQANLMKNEGIPAAMAKAFLELKGELAERLIYALKAAESLGGDLRGKQSAFIKVVKVKSSGNPYKDLVIELRVEDSEEPLKELERLYKIHKAYTFMDKGDEALALNDKEKAKEFYERATKFYINDEILFWQGLSLYLIGEKERGKKILIPLLKEEYPWKELLKRLVPQGMVKEEDLNYLLKN